jgi:hypothetical protein
MKTILAAMIVGLSIIGSSTASAQSLEQIVGAVAGYHLGNSIGDGDGRRAARVIGATLGYRYGEVILDKDYKREHDWNPPVLSNYDGYVSSGYRSDRFSKHCRKSTPREYRRDYNLTESWVRGCVARLQIEQAELERKAYEDGLQGR